MNKLKYEIDGKTVLHFRLDGGYLTNLVRSLWADEGQPEKALSILSEAFSDMTRSQQISILSGEKKLVGDEHGMDLVDDGATVSEFGNPLDPVAVYEKIQVKAKRDADHLRDTVDLLNRNTVGFGSPDGLIQVPRWRTTRDEHSPIPRQRLRDGVDLKDVLYTGSGLRDHMLSAHEKPPASEVPEPSEPCPPACQDSITTDSGWLSPDGKFYPCAWMQHDPIVFALGLEVAAVEKGGWIRMSVSFVELGGSPFGQPEKPPTQKQIDMIFDWCQETGEEQPKWLFEDGR